MALIADKPEEGLRALRIAARRDAPHSSLYLRKIKE
jgi:hypothetical protein